MSSSPALIGLDEVAVACGVIHLDGNDACNDCGAKNPDWASIDFGVLVCLHCSGYHRGFGSHITRVKSLKLDSWNSPESNEQLQFLMHSGNDAFKDYCLGNGIEYRFGSRDTKLMYESQELRYYKKMLRCRVDGSEPPSLYDFLQRPSFEAHEHKVRISGGSGSPAPASSMITTGTQVEAQRIFAANQAKSPDAKGSHWVPDRVVNKCMLCESSFNIFFRKHHCRKCGRCVCEDCAPSGNSRPLLEIGISEPVRHCKLCYRSPNIEKWKNGDVERVDESFIC